MFEPNARKALIVNRVADALRAVSIGGTVSYAALAEAAGVPRVDHAELSRARRIVEREGTARFSTVHGKGIQRLAASDVPGIGATAREVIRRKATRAAKRLLGLRANDMPADVVFRIDAERSLLGAIAEVARDAPKPREGAQYVPPTVPNIQKPS